MAVTYSTKGTSFPSFTIGKKGKTIHQGNIAPVGFGVDGDLYIQGGVTPGLWQHVEGAWSRMGNFGTKIMSETASVDTETENTVVFRIGTARIVDVTSVGATEGEKLSIVVEESQIKFTATDTDGENGVDFLFDMQGEGVFRIQSDTPTAIRSQDGSTITIEPGTISTAPGELILSGGSTVLPATAGGNLVLNPGNGPSGLGQILANPGYTPSAPNSLMTRSAVEALIAAALG